MSILSTLRLLNTKKRLHLWEQHPLAERDEELRLRYLAGVAFFLAPEREPSVNEREIFINFAEKLQLPAHEAGEQLDMRMSLDAESLLSILEELKIQELHWNLLIDAVWLQIFQGERSSKEQEVISELSVFLNQDAKIGESLSDILKNIRDNPDKNISEFIEDANIPRQLIDYFTINIPTSLKFKEILFSEIKEDRIQLAKKSPLPEDTQLKLAEDESEDVQIALASNLSLTPKTQDVLAQNGAPNVREAIAKNSCLTASTQDYLSSVGSDDVKTALAENISLIKTIQESFSVSDKWSIRRSLARNSSIEKNILLILLKDEDSDVRAAVAANPQLPDNAQQELIEDELKVQRALASNVSLAKSICAQFAKDGSSEVKEKLAQNTAIDEVIQSILVESYDSVQKSLASNIAAHPAIQKHLAEHGSADVRLQLYRNENIKDTVRKKIINSFAEIDLESANSQLKWAKERTNDAWRDYLEASKKFMEYTGKFGSFWYSQDKSDELYEKSNFESDYHSNREKEEFIIEERIKIISEILSLKLSPDF